MGPPAPDGSVAAFKPQAWELSSEWGALTFQGRLAYSIVSLSLLFGFVVIQTPSSFHDSSMTSPSFGSKTVRLTALAMPSASKMVVATAAAAAGAAFVTPMATQTAAPVRSHPAASSRGAVGKGQGTVAMVGAFGGNWDWEDGGRMFLGWHHKTIVSANYSIVCMLVVYVCDWYVLGRCPIVFFAAW